MKRIISIFFSLILCSTMLGGLSACKQHSHVFGDEWQKDSDQHWLICTAEDCGEVDKRQPHVYENECDDACDCGYQRTPLHNFSTDLKNNATHHWYECQNVNCGVKTQLSLHVYENEFDTTCECGYVRDESHNFGGAWVKDSNYHWKVCQVEGCNEIGEKYEHEFDDGVVIKPATSSQDGTKKFTCIDCGKTKTETIKYDKQKPSIKPNDVKDFVDEIVIAQENLVKDNNYTASNYTAFYDIAKAFCVIPGLDDYVPQGMDVWEDENLLLISAYPLNGMIPSSMIFAIDVETGALFGKYGIINADNSYHTSHVGGIAVTSKNLFISTGGNLLRIPLSQFYTAGTSGVIQIVESIPVPVRASFCNYSGGKLWVGDFYHPTSSSYATPEWRHLTNNDGGTYCAWSVGYNLANTESEFSKENWNPDTMEYATPDVVYSIRDYVQGFTVVNGRIVLSKSYGRNARSSLYTYEINSEAHTSVKLNGKDIPVWFLDSTNDVKAYTTLPMSEAVAEYNGKLLVLYESGSGKYIDSALDPTDRVWELTFPSK